MPRFLWATNDARFVFTIIAIKKILLELFVSGLPCPEGGAAEKEHHPMVFCRSDVLIDRWKKVFNELLDRERTKPGKTATFAAEEIRRTRMSRDLIYCNRLLEKEL
jgi:hypothetical protein